jgi:dolichol-phosphate mannosyltransferase
VDIVTASPYHPHGGVVGVPLFRLVLSQGSSLIYRLLVDRNIHTYTCLYRAYRREVIDSIQFVSDGFRNRADGEGDAGGFPRPNSRLCSTG